MAPNGYTEGEREKRVTGGRRYRETKIIINVREPSHYQLDNVNPISVLISIFPINQEKIG